MTASDVERLKAIYAADIGRPLRAHDVRRLAQCRSCHGVGLDLPVVAVQKGRGGRLEPAAHSHGLCLVLANVNHESGVQALLRLPTVELGKLRIGDVGADIMERVMETVASRPAVAARLTARQKAVLWAEAIGGSCGLFMPLETDPATAPGVAAVLAVRDSGSGPALAGVDRTVRSLYKLGLMSWGHVRGGGVWSLTNEGWQALMGLDDLAAGRAEPGRRAKRKAR